VWTDTSEGPIHCLAHHPKEDFLAVGCGSDVILASYKNHRGDPASWTDTTKLPRPSKFLRLRGPLPKPLPRSIHFLQRDDFVIVSYMDHGIV
jgi:hypothetical protein